MSVSTKPKITAVATAIRKWREGHGWTRKQAAERLNVKVRTLESWEQGRRKPPGLHALEHLWVKKPRKVKESA